MTKYRKEQFDLLWIIYNLDQEFFSFVVSFVWLSYFLCNLDVRCWWVFHGDTENHFNLTMAKKRRSPWSCGIMHLYNSGRSRVQISPPPGPINSNFWEEIESGSLIWSVDFMWKWHHLTIWFNIKYLFILHPERARLDKYE